VLFTPPAQLEAPPDATREATQAPAPRFTIPPEVREAARKDYRGHLQVGAIMAFASTLLLPPLTGLIAVALGWMAYARGPQAQRRLGLMVCAAGFVGKAIGLAVALWVEDAGLLAP
jgi:hypothetical protein